QLAGCRGPLLPPRLRPQPHRLAHPGPHTLPDRHQAPALAAHHSRAPAPAAQHLLSARHDAPPHSGAALLSALWVVLYHATHSPTVAPGNGLWHNFAGLGYLGVDIFFVISGYIMALNSHQRPPGLRQALSFFVQSGSTCRKKYPP